MSFGWQLAAPEKQDAVGPVLRPGPSELHAAATRWRLSPQAFLDSGWSWQMITLHSPHLQLTRQKEEEAGIQLLHEWSHLLSPEIKLWGHYWLRAMGGWGGYATPARPPPSTRIPAGQLGRGSWQQSLAVHKDLDETAASLSPLAQQPAASHTPWSNWAVSGH